MSLFRFKFDLESEISRKSLLYNVNWFISLRWLAVISIFLLTFLAKNLFKIALEYKVFYVIGFVVLSYNVVLYFWFKYSQRVCKGELCVHYALISAHIQIVLDIISLGFLIHFSGGVESPFLYVFIFHPIFATVILTTPSAFFYALLSIAVVGIIAVGESLGFLEHHHLEGFFKAENIDSLLFSLGTFLAFILIQFTAVVITSVIMSELRKKQMDIENIKGELEVKNEKLRKKDEMRLLFLASATHDLKSPLNTITSYVQSLLEGYMGDISEEQKKILGRILVRINGLRQLISDVLELGEFEMGEEKDIRKECFDIVKLLEQSVQEFIPQASQKGITISFEKHPESCIVCADPVKIDEVIHNYLSNAIKYNKENGSVVIKVEIISDFVRVSVSDTGIGIREEEIPKLFTDFFRSQDVKKSGIEGTGLGLGIVKRIIERYNGRVGVESVYKKGSTFFFELPRCTT
ncbi:MAG: HAMP domain-containing histidine kinase [Deltaproteobacteria bacterium]|nr:HAMP domain-containing histidine kinase [Deltaproteobacteria bacterium]